MRLLGVPVKAFVGAKARLAPVLDAESRAALGRLVAERTLAIAAALADPVVVTGDDEVREWATALGHRVVGEGAGGLDAAAGVVASTAGGPWAVLHADLPLLTADELGRALGAADEFGWALAPSSDGGTSLVAGEGAFPFSYGPGSFHRHLSARPGAAVVVGRGLAVDLDTPADLAAVRNDPSGPVVP